MCSICGIDCFACELKQDCKGCAETGGRPFGSDCAVARCCDEKGKHSCADCGNCELRRLLMEEINAMHVPGMPEVNDLNAILGRFANSEYALPGGQKAKLLDDCAVYLGNVLPSADGARLYGVVGNVEFLAVSAFAADGGNAELLVYKKR